MRLILFLLALVSSSLPIIYNDGWNERWNARWVIAYTKEPFGTNYPKWFAITKNNEEIALTEDDSDESSEYYI